MEIVLTDRDDGLPGGKLVARDGDIVAGRISWYDIKDGTVRVFDRLSVAEEYRGQHLGGYLQAEAKRRREADGVTEWTTAPMTAAGRRAVDSHVDRNYEEDPRGEAR